MKFITTLQNRITKGRFLKQYCYFFKHCGKSQHKFIIFFFLLKQISCIYSCNKLYIRACQLYKRELEIEFQRIKCFLLLGMYMNLKADENNEKNVYRSDPSPPTHMLKKLKFFVHFLERLVTIYSRPSWDPNKKKIKTRKRRSV